MRTAVKLLKLFCAFATFLVPTSSFAQYIRTDLVSNTGTVPNPADLDLVMSRPVHCMASHISGHVNGDGVANCVDLDVVKASFGKKLGQPGFNPNADVNGDGVVNVLDLSIVAKQVPAGTVCK
jgi:hypothetical protein